MTGLTGVLKESERNTQMHISSKEELFKRVTHEPDTVACTGQQINERGAATERFLQQAQQIADRTMPDELKPAT